MEWANDKRQNLASMIQLLLMKYIRGRLPCIIARRSGRLCQHGDLAATEERL
jgi:hypothetical protein